MFERTGGRVNVPGNEAERERVLREGVEDNEFYVHGVFFIDGGITVDNVAEVAASGGCASWRQQTRSRGMRRFAITAN